MMGFAALNPSYDYGLKPGLSGAKSGVSVVTSMAKQSEHGRLIAAAAMAALVPLGCRRKGQSRFWYSDQGFWIISIEFRPSGWAKGSYLHVGANWLWYPKADWGFSEDARVEDIGFIKFESAEQFEPLIAAMAARAAQEVQLRREKYTSLQAIYPDLLARAARNGMPVYHAAVAAGLLGDFATARQLFHRLQGWETYGYDWYEDIKLNGAKMAMLIDDPAEFRSSVLSTIASVRSRLRLRDDPQPFRTMSSTSGM